MAEVLYQWTGHNPKENWRVWGCLVVKRGEGNAQFASAWGPAANGTIQHKWQPPESIAAARRRYYQQVDRKAREGYSMTLTPPLHLTQRMQLLAGTTDPEPVANTDCDFCKCYDANKATHDKVLTKCGCGHDWWASHETIGASANGSFHNHACVDCACKHFKLAKPEYTAEYTARKKAFAATILPPLPDLDCTCGHWLHEHMNPQQDCLVGDCACAAYRHRCAECFSLSFNLPVHKSECLSGKDPQRVIDRLLEAQRKKEMPPAGTRLSRLVAHLITDD